MNASPFLVPEILPPLIPAGKLVWNVPVTVLSVWASVTVMVPVPARLS